MCAGQGNEHVHGHMYRYECVHARVRVEMHACTHACTHSWHAADTPQYSMHSMHSTYAHLPTHTHSCLPAGPPACQHAQKHVWHACNNCIVSSQLGKQVKYPSTSRVNAPQRNTTHCNLPLHYISKIHRSATQHNELQFNAHACSFACMLARTHAGTHKRCTYELVARQTLRSGTRVLVARRCQPLAYS